VTFDEAQEAWQEPVCGETWHHTDGEDPVPVARANRLEPFRDFADGVPYSLEQQTSFVSQQHAPAAAPEKRHSQMFFQPLDALAHRSMGDVHLLRGAREIQVPGSRFEEAKCLERGKCARHAEMIATLTADVRNDRWQSSYQHCMIQIPGAHHC